LAFKINSKQFQLINPEPPLRILLVEDDPLLGDGLAVGLRQAGFTTDWLRDGASALQALATETFDLCIIDLGLPRMDGMEVLRRTRASGRTVPILILTARDATPDKVGGLDAGADDYLVKPVDLDELSARVRALLRRSGGRAFPSIHHGEIRLDPQARTVTQAGKPVELTARELAVLELLLENVGRVISRHRLEEALYGWADETSSNTVEVYVHHLRRKLGSGLIRTLRGIGYMVPPA
jgi:DNA-binding response OmpR family regulator